MELYQVGWNAQTLSLAVMLAIIGIRARGFIDQAQRVWRVRSCAALSGITFLFFTAAFGGSLIYGWATRDPALLASSVFCGAPLVSLLVAMHRFRGFTRTERGAATAFLLFLIGMAFAPLSIKGLAFLGFGFLGAGLIGHQPWMLWKMRHRGVVSGTMLLTNVIATVAWIAYGIVHQRSLLVYATLPYLTVYCITGMLWIRLPAQHAEPA